MALPSTNIDDLEKAKFVDDGSGEPAVRVFSVTSSNTSGTLSSNVDDNELAKFVEDDNGDPAIYCIAV